MRPLARHVLEREEDVVLHLRAGASRVDLRVHELGWAEELERLVDEMRAEVEEQSARLGWLLAPGARELRPPAVDPRLEAVHRAERALADELPHREEVAVPAAVLEHGQHEAVLVGGVDEPPCLLGRRRERLVDDDREPDLERGQRIGHVEAVRRRHHDEVEVAGPLEHVLRAVEHEHAGIPLLRAPPPLGVASRDGGELEAFGRRDVRRVEHRPGEAVTEERNAKRHSHPRHLALADRVEVRSKAATKERTVAIADDVTAAKGGPGPGFGLPPPATGNALLDAVARVLLFAINAERRVDPFFRPAFDRLLRDPLSRRDDGARSTCKRRDDGLALAEERIQPDEEEHLQAIIDDVHRADARALEPGLLRARRQHEDARHRARRVHRPRRPAGAHAARHLRRAAAPTAPGCASPGRGRTSRRTSTTSAS